MCRFREEHDDEILTFLFHIIDVDSSHKEELREMVRLADYDQRAGCAIKQPVAT